MNIQRWEEGKVNELHFWREWLKKNAISCKEPKKIGKSFDFMMEGKKEVRIANLGAGAINFIGDRRRDIKIEVVASDLLADEYKKLLKELNIITYSSVEYQDMLNLTYDDESFDIVYCANALDHCKNPHKAINEMFRVCKHGGWVCIYHIAHEGKRHGYHGFHQWNIDYMEDGDCRFWGMNEENGFLLSDVYKGFTTVCIHTRKATFLKSFVKKI